MSYVEKPVRILDTKQKVLRIKTIPMVKVLWRNHALEKARWGLGIRNEGEISGTVRIG